jgi:hypothetical protein
MKPLQLCVVLNLLSKAWSKLVVNLRILWNNVLINITNRCCDFTIFVFYSWILVLNEFPNTQFKFMFLCLFKLLFEFFVQLLQLFNRTLIGEDLNIIHHINLSENSWNHLVVIRIKPIEGRLNLIILDSTKNIYSKFRLTLLQLSPQTCR